MKFLPSRVFPYNENKKYRLKNLIQGKKALRNNADFIEIKNSKKGGSFYFQGTEYKGKKSLIVPTDDLKKIIYRPEFPSGSESESILPFVVEAGQKHRANPFDPALKKISNSDILDKLKIRTISAGKKNSWQKSNFITRKNWSPTIQTADKAFISTKSGQPITLSSLLDIYDIDNNTISQLLIGDITPGDRSGYFQYKGSDYQGTYLPELEIDEIQKVKYVPGSKGTTNIVAFSASDSSGHGDEYKVKWDTLSNQKPTLNVASSNLSKDSIGEKIALSTLITASDPENDKLFLNINHNPDSIDAGYFERAGKKLGPIELKEIPFETIDDINFVVGRPGTSNVVTATISDTEHNVDGRFTLNVAENNAPITSVEDVEFLSSTSGKEIMISSYYDFMDPENDEIQNVGFIAQGDGYFTRKGNNYINKIVYFPVDELSEVRYVPGSPGSSSRVGIAVRDQWGDQKIEFANWSVLDNQEDRDVMSRSLYDRLSNTLELPKFNILMKPEYIATDPDARKFLDAINHNFGQSFSLGFNRSWGLGDLFGVPNEKEFEYFIGPDLTFADKSDGDSWSSLGFKVGYEYSTGSNALKGGLRVHSGFGLGSLALKGGISSSIEYSPEYGITINAALDDTSLDITYPRAFLKVDAEAKIKFQPSFKVLGKVPFSRTKKSSNLLGWAQINWDKKLNLVDLDTADFTGEGFSRSFSWGPFSTTARIPEFPSLRRLNSIPESITSDRLWSSASLDNGVAFGLAGNTKLLDFEFSLGDFITQLFGIPLTGEIGPYSLGPVRASGSFTLADASISAQSDLNYSLAAAIKPNLYISIEGNDDLLWIWDPTKDFTSTSYEDENDDGFVTVSIQSDPLIGVSANVGLDSDLIGRYEVLKARASGRAPLVGSKSIGFGPLFSGSFGLGDLGNFDFLDLSKVWKLSDLYPASQELLTATIDLPIS